MRSTFSAGQNRKILPILLGVLILNVHELAYQAIND